MTLRGGITATIAKLALVLAAASACQFAAYLAFWPDAHDVLAKADMDNPEDLVDVFFYDQYRFTACACSPHVDASIALRSIGDDAIPALVDGATSPRGWRGRANCLETLIEIDPHEAVAVIRELRSSAGPGDASTAEAGESILREGSTRGVVTEIAEHRFNVRLKDCVVERIAPGEIDGWTVLVSLHSEVTTPAADAAVQSIFSAIDKKEPWNGPINITFVSPIEEYGANVDDLRVLSYHWGGEHRGARPAHISLWSGVRPGSSDHGIEGLESRGVWSRKTDRIQFWPPLGDQSAS